MYNVLIMPAAIVGLVLIVVLAYLIRRVSDIGRRMDGIQPQEGAPAALQPAYQAPAALSDMSEEAEIAAAVAAVMMLLDAESAPAAEDGLTVRRIRREGARAPKWRQYGAAQ